MKIIDFISSLKINPLRFHNRERFIVTSKLNCIRNSMFIFSAIYLLDFYSSRSQFCRSQFSLCETSFYLIELTILCGKYSRIDSIAIRTNKEKSNFSCPVRTSIFYTEILNICLDSCFSDSILIVSHSEICCDLACCCIYFFCYWCFDISRHYLLCKITNLILVFCNTHLILTKRKCKTTASKCLLNPIPCLSESRTIKILEY